MNAPVRPEELVESSAWRGFRHGQWQQRVDVRDFIQRNVAPYTGDGSFLAGATERTRALWQTLAPQLLKR